MSLWGPSLLRCPPRQLCGRSWVSLSVTPGHPPHILSLSGEASSLGGPATGVPQSEVPGPPLPRVRPNPRSQDLPLLLTLDCQGFPPARRDSVAQMVGSPWRVLGRRGLKTCKGNPGKRPALWIEPWTRGQMVLPTQVLEAFRSSASARIIRDACSGSCKQDSTAQYNVTQHSTILHSMTQHTTGDTAHHR